MDELVTGTASGTQAATQSPQASVQPTSLGGTGQQTSSLQPEAANTVLDNAGGITLAGNTTLPGVNLAPSAVTLQPARPVATVHHKINAGLLSVAILLFVVAIALFAITSRSEKNTTKYI